MDWFEESEAPAKPVSVDEIDALLAQYAEADLKCKGIKAELKTANEVLSGLETRILGFLENTGRKNYSSPVGLATRVQRYSVQVPKTKEAKEAFFKYLDENGLYWDKVNINSQSLNGLYSEEVGLAEQEQRLPTQFPGIEAPTMTEYIQFRKAK